MAGEQKREVKVSLEIESSDKTKGTFARMESGLKEFQQKAGDALERTFGQAIGRGMASKIAVTQAVEAGAAIARAVNDSFSTTGQAARGLFRDIVPGGAWAQRTVDSFSGRAAGMEQSRFRAEQQQAAFDKEARLSSVMMGLNPQLAGVAERSRGLGAASPILMGAIDRSTGVGERDFREQSRLLPLKREIAKADRESQVATVSRVKAEEELGKLTTRANTLTKERAELTNRLNRDQGSGVERQRMIDRLRTVNEAANSTGELQMQARMNVYQERLREGQAQGSASAARAAEKEAQAANLEERATTAAGSATTLGMMNPFDRARSVDAVKMLQSAKGDISQLPPDLAQLALSVSGESGRRMVEGFGAKTSEYKQLSGLLPAEFGGDPETLRRQAGAARDEAEREKMKGEAAMARSAERAGEGLGDAISAAMERFLQAALIRIENNMRNLKNAP